MKYLIAGLGNIGDEYKHTRHNIGFDIISEFAKSKNAEFKTERYGDIAKTNIKGRQLILLKPSTFMNLSGNAVRYWMKTEKIPIENILILVDDIALNYGTLRMKPGGSAGGHNGLKNIQESLGTEKYARLRFGLGNGYSKGKQIDFVLGGWSPEELEILPQRISLATEMIKSFCLQGVQETMNEYNNK